MKGIIGRGGGEVKGMRDMGGDGELMSHAVHLPVVFYEWLFFIKTLALNIDQFARTDGGGDAG